MKNKILKIAQAALLVSVLSFAQVSIAADGGTPPPGTNCKFDQSSEEFCNPLPDRNLEDLILRILKFFIATISVVALAVIVFSGFKMVISAGNEEVVKSAKAGLTWSLIGLVISLLAYSFVAIVQNLLTSGTPD